MRPHRSRPWPDNTRYSASLEEQLYPWWERADGGRLALSRPKPHRAQAAIHYDPTEWAQAAYPENTGTKRAAHTRLRSATRENRRDRELHSVQPRLLSMLPATVDRSALSPG